MTSFFRRPPATTCYYCQTPIASSSPSSASLFDPSSFRCPHCRCWNRYDAHGRIVGDEPAMYDERLNVESFMKRGSPDRNYLPSLVDGSRANLFCHTCRTNQMLLINLLAAYLPASSDPTYAARAAALPTYRAALNARYPPVCAKCAPDVDAEIARRDEMARMRALGGALQVSHAAARRRPGVARAGSMKGAERSTRLGSWRARGVLWAGSFLVAMLGDAAGALDIRMPSWLWTLAPILPVLVLASLTWAFWDPTYSLQRSSSVRGREVRIEGRQKYIILQSHAWIARLAISALFFSSWLSPEWDPLHIRGTSPEYTNNSSKRRAFFTGLLALEIIVLVLSYFSITIHKPAPIRLIDTSAHRVLCGPDPASHTSTHVSLPTPSPNGSAALAPSSQADIGLSEPDLFATLSLSSNPDILSNAMNPIFGRPSLPSSAPRHDYTSAPASQNSTNGAYGDDDDDPEDFRHPMRDPDAMDWEPASPAVARQQSFEKTRAAATESDDGSWLRRQRFFPPEEPTGLEGLFMRTRLVDEDEPGRRVSTGKHGPDPTAKARWRWGWVYSVSVLPVAVLLAGLWLGRRLHS